MREIRIPIIKVKTRDIKGNDYEHIVGTDCHDQLYIEDGAINYLNIQCMSGTGKGNDINKGGYEFVGEENDWDGTVEIEMVTIQEFAELYADLFKTAREGEQNLQEVLKKVFAEAEKNEQFRNSEGYIPHT